MSFFAPQFSKKKGSLNDWLFNRNFCYMEESLRAKRFFGMCVFSGAQWMGQLLILIRGVKFFFLHSNRWVLKSRFLSMEFLDKLGSKKKLQLTKARYAHSFSLDPKCDMILLKWVGAILGWENSVCTPKPWYSE